jgi:hypothetical protein
MGRCFLERRGWQQQRWFILRIGSQMVIYDKRAMAGAEHVRRRRTGSGKPKFHRPEGPVVAKKFGA